MSSGWFGSRTPDERLTGWLLMKSCNEIDDQLKKEWKMDGTPRTGSTSHFLGRHCGSPHLLLPVTVQYQSTRRGRCPGLGKIRHYQTRVVKQRPFGSRSGKCMGSCKFLTNFNDLRDISDAECEVWLTLMWTLRYVWSRAFARAIFWVSPKPTRTKISY